MPHPYFLSPRQTGTHQQEKQFVRKHAKFKIGLFTAGGYWPSSNGNRNWQSTIVGKLCNFPGNFLGRQIAGRIGLD